MEDLPEFLSDAPAAASEAPQVQETVAPATPAPAAQQEAPATPPAAAPAQPAPAAPQAPAADPAVAQHVPLSTFLDMRDQKTAAERKAKELETWRNQQEAAARRQPVPDPEVDPAGYQQHQAAQFQSALYTQQLNISRRFAEMQHGPDVTKTAFDWGAARCDQDPFFNEKVRASADPVGFVVDEWKREQLLTKLDPTQIEAFQAWQAAQAGQAPAAVTQQAAPAAQAAARPVAPRPSLAAAPSAGAHSGPEARDGEAQFSAMFNK